jgi:hypothetical protein
MPVAIINSNNIADWCSNDRQILVTPSCFAVRPFLLTSLLINIYFPTYNKMAIIGTLPSRFSDKNQQLYKGSLIRACAYKLFIFPSKVSRLVTFKIMRHLKGCIGIHRNNQTKPRKNGDNWSSTSIVLRTWCKWIKVENFQGGRC